MEILIAPEKIIDQTGISKMSLAQRIKIMEAIEKTVIEEIEVMGFPPDDADDEGKDDVTLAQEALEEYRANPSSARPWDEVYKELKARLKE